MAGDTQPCILTDYVAIVGTSQDFGLGYSIISHRKQLARAAINNLSGLEQVISGGMMASGNPNSGYRVIEEGIAQMERNTDFANKMMFAAQAVRGLRVNSGGADYKTLIYFSSGYTSEQRLAIEAAGARHASAGRTFAVSSSAQLIGLLNESQFQNQPCERRVRRIDIYTHGVPEDLAFGWQGPQASQQTFTTAEVAQLDPDRFQLPGRESQIYSWACQTSTTRSGGVGGLAPAIANHTGATVHAYARRTDYSLTWNTGSATAQDAGLTEIVSSDSRVLWHPDGAMRGVVEGSSPEENPSGRFVFRPVDEGG